MGQKTTEGRGAGRRTRPSKSVVRQIDNQGNRATDRILARAMTAVLDREGMVVCVLASRVEARAYLRGGCA